MRIFGRIATAVATSVVVGSVFAGSVQAAPSAPDPYSSKINTTTTVTTPSPIRVGTNVDISVKVTANSPQQPAGKVTLTLHSSPGGAGQALVAAAGPDGWTRTISYDGGTETVRGPSFPKVGTWLVTAVFRPADTSTFRGSRDATTFKVIAGDGGPDDDGDDDNGGLLPDTGGPALLWLLLGLALVGGGAGAVVVSRRRRDATPQPAI